MRQSVSDGGHLKSASALKSCGGSWINKQKQTEGESILIIW